MENPTFSTNVLREKETAQTLRPSRISPCPVPIWVLHFFQFLFGQLVDKCHADAVSQNIDNSVAAVSERHKSHETIKAENTSTSRCMLFDILTHMSTILSPHK